MLSHDFRWRIWRPNQHRNRYICWRSFGYDGAPLSHHILTTDGILGRDTLAETPPNPLAATWDWPRLTTKRQQLGPAVDHRASFDVILIDPEEDQP